MNTTATSQRSVQQIFHSHPSTDGAGVKLLRLAFFNTPSTWPFLMLDEFGSDVPEDYIAGFPPHPHRGIETLTYMLHGSIEHQDSSGHKRRVSSGGAQWMSTGRGIIHSEMPLREDAGTRRLRGFQIWINLPARDKMKVPEYQDVDVSEIPVLRQPGLGSLRIIGGCWTLAGETALGPLQKLAQQARMTDLEILPESTLRIPVHTSERVLLRIYAGSLTTGPITAAQATSGNTTVAGPGDLLLFGAGNELALTSHSDGVRALILAAQPLAEPLAHQGPFVMNTHAEIEQTIREYRSGHFLD